MSRLADLIAGQCRVRVGDVEGALDGYTSQVMWLLVAGERLEVPFGQPVELEPLDEDKVAAHWAAVAESDAAKLAERANARAAEALAGLDSDQLDEVVREARARLEGVR